MSKVTDAKAILDSAVARRDSYRRINLEGGHGYNPHESEVLTALEAYNAAKDQHNIEHFAEIRAAWNTAIKAHTMANGNMDCGIGDIEREVGITHYQLKVAKRAVEG